ncbi:hypothetical protein TNCV_2768871 [Trichonephila clavipes]|nr:hypothetical protein TNCV_2768871 [Trichonephila clavipes]
MDEILTTARDLELEMNEDDIEELLIGHEDELTTDELQEILNEELHETYTSALDHIILNRGQVTWTSPELEPPLLTTTPTGGRFSF